MDSQLYAPISSHLIALRGRYFLVIDYPLLFSEIADRATGVGWFRPKYGCGVHNHPWLVFLDIDSYLWKVPLVPLTMCLNG